MDNMTCLFSVNKIISVIYNSTEFIIFKSLARRKRLKCECVAFHMHLLLQVDSSGGAEWGIWILHKTILNDIQILQWFSSWIFEIIPLCMCVVIKSLDLIEYSLNCKWSNILIDFFSHFLCGFYMHHVRIHFNKQIRMSGVQCMS